VRTILVLGLAVLTVGVLGDVVQPQVNADGIAIEAEAREFMKRYAQDLQLRRREALAAYYSRSGAFFPHRLAATRRSFESVDAIYRSPSKWKGPDVFEWRDLAYEVLGPDAVVVVGSFLWQEPPETKATEYSYSNLLVRESGHLRIRVEHEAVRVTD
jgi:hypothetical protein